MGRTRNYKLRAEIESCYVQRGKRQPSDSELDAKLRREWKPEPWDRTKRTVNDDKPHQ